jgi:DUF4097 and DUF4098 domain-containing protein YvlB
MTRKAVKWATVIFITTLFLLPSCPSLAKARQEYTFPQEKTVLLPPGALISVQNISGDIDIRGGDVDEVVITATKRVKANSREEAEEWAKKVNIIFDKREQGLFIETKMPPAWTESLGSLLSSLFEKKPSVQVDFKIRSPQEVNVHAASVSGDIYIAAIGGDVDIDVVSGDMEISEIGGDLSIDAVSGDISVEDLAGNLEIDATSGDVEIVNVGGDVTIDVTSGDVIGRRIMGEFSVDGTSGDVSISDVHGDVSVDVTSGDISVRQKAGNLWIDTSSGDIYVETMVIKDGRYRVDTSSGQIIFHISETSSCTVDLETSGGRIHAKLPMIVDSVSRTRLQGTMGTGGAQISLSTSGGDIDLLPLE